MISFHQYSIIIVYWDESEWLNNRSVIYALICESGAAFKKWTHWRFQLDYNQITYQNPIIKPLCHSLSPCLSSHLTHFLSICNSPCHWCPCWCVYVCVWVRCQHFIRNRSADGLSPHLKDAARRGEAHLCHGWHFNLSPFAVLFPSIVHQCIRTNATGHKGISGFDTIDTHLWLRLHCFGCRGNWPRPIGVWEEERRRRVRWQQISHEEIIQRSNLQTYKSPLKYRHVRSLRGQQENYNSFTKQCFILVEHFHFSACSTHMNSWTVNQCQRCISLKP